jgi:uncharacterized protein (TIGR02611 family)
MSRSVKILRKIIVAFIGVPIIVLGIILIPLPGPGILIVFLGLFILSLEFEWVRPHMERAKGELQKIIQKSKARQEAINKKLE